MILPEWSLQNIELFLSLVCLRAFGSFHYLQDTLHPQSGIQDLYSLAFRTFTAWPQMTLQLQGWLCSPFLQAARVSLRPQGLAQGQSLWHLQWIVVEWLSGPAGWLHSRKFPLPEEEQLPRFAECTSLHEMISRSRAGSSPAQNSTSFRLKEAPSCALTPPQQRPPDVQARKQIAARSMSSPLFLTHSPRISGLSGVDHTSETWS